MKKTLLIICLGLVTLTACSTHYQKPSGPKEQPGDTIDIQLDTNVNLPENLTSEE